MADQASQIDRQDGDKNMQNSDNPQKPNISNPVDTDGSPNATHGTIPQSVDSLLQLELKDKVPKSKENQPRKANPSPKRGMFRPCRANIDIDEHSPFRHHHEARILDNGGSFVPSQERNVSSPSNTPGRSRLEAGGGADDSIWCCFKWGKK